jgi:hypothetical protein
MIGASKLTLTLSREFLASATPFGTSGTETVKSLDPSRRSLVSAIVPIPPLGGMALAQGTKGDSGSLFWQEAHTRPTATHQSRNPLCAHAAK